MGSGAIAKGRMPYSRCNTCSCRVAHASDVCAALPSQGRHAHLDLEEVGRDVVGSGVHLCNQHLVIARKCLAHLQSEAAQSRASETAGRRWLTTASCSSTLPAIISLHANPQTCPTPLLPGQSRSQTMSRQVASAR